MTIRQTVATWAGTDADLLVALNAKNIQRKTTGVVSLSKFAELYSEALAGEFRYAFTTEIARLNGTGTPANVKLASWLSGMVSRFDVDGLDFTDTTIRARITNVLQRAGYGNGQINAVLSNGYVLDSLADQELQRDALQADVDAVRLTIQKEGLEDTASNRLQAYREALTAWDGTPGSEPVL